jgi:hypothetical protein
LKIPIFGGHTQAAENSCARLSATLIFGSLGLAAENNCLFSGFFDSQELPKITLISYFRWHKAYFRRFLIVENDFRTVVDGRSMTHLMLLYVLLVN